MVEISGVGASARHTTAVALVRQAQLEGETTVPLVRSCQTDFMVRPASLLTGPRWLSTAPLRPTLRPNKSAPVEKFGNASRCRVTEGGKFSCVALIHCLARSADSSVTAP